MADVERDEITGTETTGHEWDGIKELNTPLPRWWLWTFYITIVWALVYTIFFPAWPLITSATGGLLGYSSRADVAAAVERAREAQGGYYGQIEEASLEQIVNDEELFQFAVAGGRSAFANNCSQCHGSGAAGFEGYPNLNDDDWLWGGSLEDIHTTLLHGIRYEQNDETRYSEMPAFGRDGILQRDEIIQLADYVRSLSDPSVEVEDGAEELYLNNCSACHGEDGGGDRMQGAPALNDAIWLYGGDVESIVETITHSRYGVMPGWSHRLDEATIKQLTVYVHALGVGE
ncbi:MAG: cytochrome-c oxidase, cbb3-type subunit III [Geminicoccaceae bacterium]